jgi:hypothetical protein
MLEMLRAAVMPEIVVLCGSEAWRISWLSGQLFRAAQNQDVSE